MKQYEELLKKIKESEPLLRDKIYSQSCETLQKAISERPEATSSEIAQATGLSLREVDRMRARLQRGALRDKGPAVEGEAKAESGPELTEAEEEELIGLITKLNTSFAGKEAGYGHMHRGHSGHMEFGHGKRGSQREGSPHHRHSQK